MTTTTHRPAGYRHGLRVRMGTPDGPRGVLLECDSRAGRKYWRVRLQTGEWKWPNELGGLIVDGDGDAVSECASCGLRFILRTGSGDLICTRCDYEQFGTEARVSDPPPARRFHERRRWIKRRGHV
jgi:hypothetical protein